MNGTVNRQWLLRRRPEGMVQQSDFEWVTSPPANPRDGEVQVRTIYLSLDPANRAWMAERASYMPPVPLGGVMRGGGVGVVTRTRFPALPEGQLVQGPLGWQDYACVAGDSLTPLPPLGLPLPAHLAVLGHIGLTAYFGLMEIGCPKSGETLVVSAAAGAVGSLVGQIGKIQGCRVVGICGSDDKVEWITKELGFDAGINYKTEDLAKSLKRACPDGIDIDFENVGGAVFDAVLGQINLRARVVLCGLISQYNATEPVPGPYHFANVLTRRARVEGFIVLDYLNRAMEAVGQLAQWLQEGRLSYRADIVDGLENAPTALNRLFRGENQGKLMLRVSEEP